MIRWSFWIDSWEHPFNTWSKPPLPDSAQITSAIRQPNKLPRFTPGPRVPGEPSPIVEKPEPKPKIYSPTNGLSYPWPRDIFGQRIFEPESTFTRRPTVQQRIDFIDAWMDEHPGSIPIAAGTFAKMLTYMEGTLSPFAHDTYPDDLQYDTDKPPGY